MNQPLRKLGVQNGHAVYDLNGTQTKLEGFTPTAMYLGHDQKGRPMFAPTRKQRRAGMQKRNRRAAFGMHVHHWQQVVDKNGNLKRIPHFYNRVSQSSNE